MYFNKEFKDLREDYDETIIEISEGAEEMKQEIDNLIEENKDLKNKN